MNFDTCDQYPTPDQYPQEGPQWDRLLASYVEEHHAWSLELGTDQ